MYSLKMMAINYWVYVSILLITSWLQKLVTMKNSFQHNDTYANSIV